MIEITKENYKDIDFNGVIISVPRKHLKNELTQEFCFHFECAYYTKGEHGYKTPGHNPDRSSFFTLWYSDEDMPNGFGFNSTSRLPWDEKYLHFNNVRYYKFEDMEEFCLWYLQKKGKYRITDNQGWLSYISPISESKKDLLTQLQQDPGYFKPTSVEKYQFKEWKQEKCNTNTPPTTVPKCPSKGNKSKHTNIPPTSIPENILKQFETTPPTGLEIPDYILSKEQLKEFVEYPGYRRRCNQPYMKEIQGYVQRVMNIIDCKNSYEKTGDERYKEKQQEKQQELLDWLNEEV